MGAKILVVEDDHFLVQAYRAKLEKEGFTVETATDGNQALMQLQIFVPELVILDIVMPNKNGFAVLSEMKQMERFKNIPVIVASNLTQVADIQRAKDLDATEFFTKSSMSLDDLVQKIRAYL